MHVDSAALPNPATPPVDGSLARQQRCCGASRKPRICWPVTYAGGSSADRDMFPSPQPCWRSAEPSEHQLPKHQHQKRDGATWTRSQVCEYPWNGDATMLGKAQLPLQRQQGGRAASAEDSLRGARQIQRGTNGAPVEGTILKTGQGSRRTAKYKYQGLVAPVSHRLSHPPSSCLR